MAEEPVTTRLERVASLFQAHGVEFLVIGGMAEALFGSPRPTYDVDLCYRRTPENIKRLAAALGEIKPGLRGLPEGVPFTVDARALSQGTNFTLTTSLGDLDLLGEVMPLGGYDELLRSAESYPLGRTDVRTIGLDDLIAVKRHVGRTKDSESLYQLLAIKRERERMERGG